MKNLFSIWSGRLMILLFPAALVASALVPSQVLAYQGMSNGGHVTGSLEGDPLDTNDYGGGGSGSDVHDDGGAAPVDSPRIPDLQKIRVLLITEFLGGTLIFKIIIIKETSFGVTSVEEIHAP